MPLEDDSIDIIRLQSLLTKDLSHEDTSESSSTQILPQSSPPTADPPTTPTNPGSSFSANVSPTSVQDRTDTTSHDRTGSLQLAYSIPYSQIDLGETQVDSASLQEAIANSVNGIIPNSQLQRLRSSTGTKPSPNHEHGKDSGEACGPPNAKATLQSDDDEDEDLADNDADDPESRPTYFPEANRFDTPRQQPSSVKKPPGHNPLAIMKLRGNALPGNLKQMFDTVSSPLRPLGERSIPEIPVTPAAHAAQMMAASMIRTRTDESEPISPTSPPSKTSESPQKKTMTQQLETYVTMKQSQEERERRKGISQLQQRQRKSRERSASPVFPSSPGQEQGNIDSDDDLMSSSEVRRKKVAAARKKGDEEVRRLFREVTAPRILNPKAPEFKVPTSKEEGKPDRPRARARIPEDDSTDEEGEEEEATQPTQLLYPILRTVPTSSSPIQSLPPPPQILEKPDPPISRFSKPSSNLSEESDHEPTLAARHAAHMQPVDIDWDKLHDVQTSKPIRRSRSNNSLLSRPGLATSSANQSVSFPKPAAPSQASGPNLNKQGTNLTKTSVRNLPPFNISSPSPKRNKDSVDKVPDMVPETSGLSMMEAQPEGGPQTSSLTTLPPLSSSVSLDFPQIVLSSSSAEMNSAFASRKSKCPASGKRKRMATRSTSPGDTDFVPCSIPELNDRDGVASIPMRNLASIDRSSAFFSSRPDPEDADMADIDVNTVVDTPKPKTSEPALPQNESLRTPAAKRRKIPAEKKAAEPSVDEASTVKSKGKKSKSASKGSEKLKLDTQTTKVNSSKNPRWISSKATSKAARRTRSATSLEFGGDTPTAVIGPNGRTEYENTMPIVPNTALPSPEENTSIVAPNRIFALFKDGKLFYHPATVIASESQTQVRVVFDDGSEDFLEGTCIRSLDLRTGDVVKVDLPNMKKFSWVIAEFPPPSIPEETEPVTPGLVVPPTRLTDIRGHETIRVVKKVGNSQLSETTNEAVVVPVTRIYLVKNLWVQFSERHYISNSGPSLTGTPLPITTPTSPFRRRMNTPLAARQPFPTRPGNLFSSMVFALSFVDNEVQKRSIIAKIQYNGGRILETGFEELFLDTSERENKEGAPGEDVAFVLKPETERIGFACVIADRHSRRAKFLLALALGIPCLAGRWIEDCVRKGRILDWEPYLLPAGESAYLGGAVKSRILAGFPAVGIAFQGIVERRRKLFEGKNIIVVMGKAVEKRKAYLFLTSALGAERVAKCSSLEAASKVLQAGERWNWVYVEGKEKERGERVCGRWGVRIVDDEWVVQSVILGSIIEDE